MDSASTILGKETGKKHLVHNLPLFFEWLTRSDVMFTAAVGITWQTGLTAAPIFLVIQNFLKMWMALGVVAVCSEVLKVSWLDRLRDEGFSRKS